MLEAAELQWGRRRWRQRPHICCQFYNNDEVETEEIHMGRGNCSMNMVWRSEAFYNMEEIQSIDYHYPPRIRHCIRRRRSGSQSSMICLTLLLSFIFVPEFSVDAFNIPTNTRRGRIKVSYLSAPPKDSDSHSLDAQQDDIIRDQRSNKSLKNSSRKRKVQKRNNHSTLPTEPTTKNSSNRRRKVRSSAKSLHISEPESAVQMPPWLAQYEDEDFAASYYLAEELQCTSQLVEDGFNSDDNEQPQLKHLLSEMKRLQLALNGIYHHHNTQHPITSTIIPYFTPSEINDVLDSIRVASHGNANLMAGCADFLYLMLTLEEEGVLYSELLETPWDSIDNERDDDGVEHHSIMTRDVLVAGAFHYCDCVRARKAGVYDYAKQAMEASLDIGVMEELEMKRELAWLPAAADIGETLEVSKEQNKLVAVGDIERRAPDLSKSSIEHYGEESVQILQSAARLKKAEIMVATVNGSNGGSSSSQIISRRAQTNGDAEILRSFLVSLSEDWRALVIRSAACLYRLKGITNEYDDVGGSIVLSKSTMNVARDAFKVYAPLAQRLGMQRLKKELESVAFRILYPRQNSVASSLYRGDIDEMKSIVQVLSERIEQLLRSDPVFTEQIDDVAVTSRVKQPYSMWKKMLRARKEAADAASSVGNKKRHFASTPTLRWIPDAIALRVVLRAARLSPMEDEESLRTREKLLCYYALQLIQNVWEASDANEAKDYIKNPKPNGYQSLHYTASLMIGGEEWPFEVQIRSEEMHRIAEYGVASHWDYKQQVTKALPDSLPQETTPTILALPSELTNITDAVPETLLRTSRKFKKKSRLLASSRVASYIEALTTSRETIVQNNLFIFLSSTDSALDGKILSIDPSTSKVADILQKYGGNEEDIIEYLDGLMIYQNGVRISLDEELSNGDVLTIPSSIIDKLII